MREDKEFTQWWHNNAIGMWERWIPLTVKKGLEIGSFEGASAVWLMDNRPDLQLSCVDIFGPAFDDVTGEYEQRFERNVAEYGDRITKLKGKSADVLKTLPRRATYDLIYIDGDHSYEGAKIDAELAYPLLKKGGVLIFDDYNNDQFGVKQAVDEFLENAGGFVSLREPDDYQMAIKRV